ncbi:hypothetical protein CCP3SC5AM1_3590002 [Gammaproteobacteria bacterium]
MPGRIGGLQTQLKNFGSRPKNLAPPAFRGANANANHYMVSKPVNVTNIGKTASLYLSTILKEANMTGPMAGPVAPAPKPTPAIPPSSLVHPNMQVVKSIPTLNTPGGLQLAQNKPAQPQPMAFA